jgi:hypothetical protein
MSVLALLTTAPSGESSWLDILHSGLSERQAAAGHIHDSNAIEVGNQYDRSKPRGLVMPGTGLNWLILPAQAALLRRFT